MRYTVYSPDQGERTVYAQNAIGALASVIPCSYLIRQCAGHAGRDYASFEVEGIGTYLVVPADVSTKVTIYKATGNDSEVTK